MNRPDFCEENDIVAWLILGYLCSYPDAKDTAEGVRHWWLSREGISVEGGVVRGSLNYLARLGWVSVTNGKAGQIVYGLKLSRRQALRQFMSTEPIIH